MNNNNFNGNAVIKKVIELKNWIEAAKLRIRKSM